jgi:hypothetical protein
MLVELNKVILFFDEETFTNKYWILFYNKTKNKSLGPECVKC